MSEYVAVGEWVGVSLSECVAVSKWVGGLRGVSAILHRRMDE